MKNHNDQKQEVTIETLPPLFDTKTLSTALGLTPSQKKERSRRWNARVYSIYFCNLATNTSTYAKLPPLFKISLVL